MRDRSVSLNRVLAPFVTERTRAKGHAYYLRGAVTSIDTTGSYLSAIVHGTRMYHVTIFPNEGGFTASCDCPFFVENHDICKHIWATILSADAGGMLGSYGAETWLDVAGDKPVPGGPAQHATPDQWERFIGGVLQQVAASETRPGRRFLNGQVIYALDRSLTLQGQGIALTVMWRQRKKNGEWGKAQPLAVTTQELEHLPDPADREILALLSGAADHFPGDAYTPLQSRASFRLAGPLTDRTLWMIASSGRLALRTGPHDADDMTPIAADTGPPWVFRFDIDETDDGSMQLSGILQRGEERMPVSEPQLVLASGHLIARGALARLDHGDAFTWLAELRRTGPATFPPEAAPALTEALVRSRVDPAILPAGLRYDVVDTAPRPRLHVARLTKVTYATRAGDLEAHVTFDYDDTIVPAGTGATAYDPVRRRMIRRNLNDEQRYVERLHQLGFRRGWGQGSQMGEFLVGSEQFDRAVRTLVSEAWRVDAEGAVYRNANAMRLQVSSGIDWFELHGDVDFGTGESVPLTRLLSSLKRGERSIVLGDGTRGMVPDEWLRRYARIAGFGEVEGDHVRYRPSQTALLDALLEAQPAVSIDQTFARARDAMRSFEGIRHQEPPSTFIGQLRDYQMEALGWFDFLRQFGFGGCLADDMGLGKTVMVLALLDARRQEPARERRPSLAVVPRSLVFNWIAEARRFAPHLRVLDYTGPQRVNARLDDHDLVLTTYGTLRRDAPTLKDYEFDYLILDEAQAIKNAVTATAKAVRLLRGRHRLALSGTPVENHIGELWSLFEFLNPGLLGSSSAFARASAVQRRDGGEDLALVARALKPLILRRTKAQVAPELPERTEQTIHCELEGPQRTFYDELRAHYRSTLFARVEREGLDRSKIHVLEALLRLRQAASHAGLVDDARVSDGSAKFDLLVPRLQEIVEEGHKALVFSQFTQLLGLLKPRLDQAGIVYEYLDGKTRDREARVQRFSTDPGCGVFLISLKAGGLGLNLTAAEYVFLLDPWWNPAAEAQAIDRAHRIGQSQQVFAYRLIARDTVEEKVAELQASKRELADAILSADPGLLRNLRTEDLELLLS